MSDEQAEIEALKARLAALEGQQSQSPPPPQAPPPKKGGCATAIIVACFLVFVVFALAQCDASSPSTTTTTATSWTPPAGYFVEPSTRGRGAVATKWSEATNSECRGSGVTCWALDAVTEEGCSRNLYVSVSLLNETGQNIGWTNDSAQGVLAGQEVRLVFTSYERGATTARVAEVSCY